MPPRASFRADLIAGVPGAISSVPDGMAAGVLAGVNPIHGLYASFAGPIFGGATASTRLMVITTTSAAALAAGSALQTVPEHDRPDALVLLTVVAGLVMVGAGVARLGRYTRFVSHSVMSGFLTGIALNIVLGQIPDFSGASAEGSINLTKAWDVVIHPSHVDIATLLTGLAALALLIGLGRTRLSLFSSLIALILPTAGVLLLQLDQVADVNDVGSIPTGIPLPHIPDFGVLSLSIISGAFAVAAIILVQGAGVAESAANPDGSRSRPDRDFAAQGLGNVGSAIFAGQPVGGSVGQTALNVTAGARSRWGAIWSGVWMLVILVMFAGVVGKVAMATLSAVLMFAAVGSLRPGQVMTIWKTGLSSKFALATTFVATLTLPVTAAVGIGVALSLLLQLNQEAVDLKIVRLVPEPDGRLLEVAAPTTLHDGEVLVLDVYGSLFYAGSRTLQAHLPDPAGAEAPSVILRLRGRTTLGATFFSVIGDYARKLEARGGRLYLSGLSDDLLSYWRDDRLSGLGVSLEVFPATEVIGQSTREAYMEAKGRRVRGHD